jgi:nitrate reductase gamma subunit
MNAGLSHFIEFELQIIALAWMAVMYTIKSVQLSRLPLTREMGPRAGSVSGGIFASYKRMFMPWAMESSKKHSWRWFEFAIYHVGAFIAILNTFTTPFAPSMMTVPVRVAFAVLIAPAFAAGLIKLIRRFTSDTLRHVSNFDDYFSLVSLELFFFFGIMALVMDTPVWNTTYFLVAAFFLFYVPFSKISHYIYFFFAAAITGSRYGWRGVSPEAGR